MRFKKYLDFGKYIEPLMRLSSKNIKKKLKSSWEQFEDMVSKEPELEEKILQLINKKTGSRFRSLSQVSKKHIKESAELNEDLQHFFDWFADQGWGAVSIFPTLSLWFEVDSLFDEFALSSIDFRRVIVYSLIWLALVTGKHISMWNKWKKENPEEYEEEGKPGPFTKEKK